MKMKTTVSAFSPTFRTTALALCLTGLAVATLGCGGGSNSGGVGSVTTGGQTATRGAGRALFTITWPKAAPASRLIPQASNSIGVEVLYDGEVIARKVAVRDPSNPAQQVSFDNLPIASVTIRATAYPTMDGTGIGQATGAQELAIRDGEAATIALTMGTTIVRLALTPQTSTLASGKTLTLLASAYDKDDAVVLTHPVWKSSDEAVARVSQTGVVTPQPLDEDSDTRTVTITATDAESGQAAKTAISVTPPVSPNPGPAQFSPLARGNGTPLSGDLILDSSAAYTINSDTATITDADGLIVAQGKIVTRYLGPDAAPVKYAVFAVTGNIRISGDRTVTARGSYPVVLLARGSFTLENKATLNVSGLGSIAGAGGNAVGSGPGAGATDGTRYGGGSFGGRGGGPTAGAPYGSDFDSVTAPYLQGGSGGAGGSGIPTFGGAGGGAVYIASVRLLSIDNAGITANGGSGDRAGGSGGGVALWSGTALRFSSATITASGGAGDNGGGGGRVVVGYPAGVSTPDTRFINVSGGGSNGSPGTVSARNFAGF